MHVVTSHRCGALQLVMQLAGQLCKLDDVKIFDSSCACAENAVVHVLRTPVL